MFSLDPRRDAEYSDFITVYNIIFDKMESGVDTLTTSEYSTLETIASKQVTLAAGLATVTLSEYSDYDFIEVLVKPVFEGKSARSSGADNRIKVEERLLCKVYPNPTNGILMVELPDAYENVKASVLDGMGKQVFQESNLNGMATLNLRHLSTGSYTLQLENGDKTLFEHHSIQIVR